MLKLRDNRTGVEYEKYMRDGDVGTLNADSKFFMSFPAGYEVEIPVTVFDDEDVPVEVVFTAPKDPTTPDELLKWVHVRLGEVEVMDPKILGVRGREQEGTPHQLKIREYQAARDEIQDAIARFYNPEVEE